MVRKKSIPTKRPVSAIKRDDTNKSSRTSKIHRYRPGATVLREIRQYQQPSSTIIPKLAFQRLARQISLSVDESIRFQKSAVFALQIASEEHLITIFEEANACTEHANRSTLMIKDVQLAMRIRNRCI